MYIRKVNFNRVFVAGMATLVIMMLGACSRNVSDSTEYQKLVKTAQAEQVSPVKNKNFPGVMEEADEINLAFRVAGPIDKILVKEGQHVKKGQLIAEMDTRDYLIQVNTIETQVNQLQSEYDRIAELHRRKSVSDNDYEKMKAGKEMAEAKLKNARDQLKDTKLYSPFSGYITKVMFEDGEMVNHGTPIAKLIDISALKVDVEVPASLYLHKDKITGIDCTQDNLPADTFRLRLTGNNIKANSNGLYKFYLYYDPEPGSKLLPGMNVLVRISYMPEYSRLISIPASALFEKDGNSHVYVLDDSSRVNMRQVRTNNTIKDGNVSIIEGLEAGDEVVIGGLDLLHQGEKVKVMAPKSKTNIGNLL
ncbi:MAG TPA: efflux RND transporter periplasmic adaptor subunit [Bacteroidales bacterium]|nr:efflux RND transporter periplasmic adaptor subunit [Bacteroidales bacterium]